MKKRELLILIVLTLSLLQILVSCSEQHPAKTIENSSVVLASDRDYASYPDFITVPVRQSDAREVFVNPIIEGNIGDGSFEKPYGSLQRAFDLSLPGDLIYLMEGTYHGRATVNAHGAADNWIVVRPYNNARVVFDGNNGIDQGGTCIQPTDSAEYILFEGFEIKNYAGAGIWTLAGADHIYMESLVIHDISNPAFSPYGTEGILGAGDNILVRGCYIYDIGLDRLSASDHGIYMLDAQNWVIDNNYFRNIPGGGIHQFMGYENRVFATGIYVTDNTFSENLYHIVLSSCDDFHINGNIFINAKETDFYILNRVEGVDATGNIFYNAYSPKMKYLKGNWKSLTIRENLVKSYFIFADDPEFFETNNFSDNFIIYEEMPFRIKYAGDLEELDSPADIGKFDSRNIYDNNSYANTYLFNSSVISDAAALIKAVICR